MATWYEILSLCWPRSRQAVPLSETAPAGIPSLIYHLLYLSLSLCAGPVQFAPASLPGAASVPLCPFFSAILPALSEQWSAAQYRDSVRAACACIFG